MRTRNKEHAVHRPLEDGTAQGEAQVWANGLAAPHSQDCSLGSETKGAGDTANQHGTSGLNRPPYRVAERPRVPSPFRAIRGPEDVYDVCPGMRNRRQEQFAVLLLNARHEVTRRAVVSQGSLNASIVHPREVFRPAILGSAASVILVHNHPSGDPEPSEEDLSITRRLAQVGELLGIPVLDHVVVGKRGFVSLRARGQL